VVAVAGMSVAELMKTKDAVEGLAAFLDRRPPVWRHS
jgi:enoyl-CoA hydratase/carnithine racemase